MGSVDTARCNSNQRSSFHDRTGLPATPTTVSPVNKPARAAALCGAGVPTTALGSNTPTTLRNQYTATASNRLATGPAITIAIRFATGCRLNARGRSAAAIGWHSGSRSSSMRT